MRYTRLPRALKHVTLWTTLAATSQVVGPQTAFADQPTSVPADGDDAATSELIRRGFVELQRDDLEAAREAFAAAWARRPAVVVALSLAQVEMRLGRFAEAAEHWQFLLLHLQGAGSDQRKAAAEQLEVCRAHIGSVTLQVAPDGATVVVDEKPVGQAPLNRMVFLEPGTHTVYASHAGRRSDELTFQISAGSRLSFSLRIAAAASQPTPRTEPPRPSRALAHHTGTNTRPERSSIRSPLLIGGALLASSSAALGIYFAIKSSEASDSASAARAAAESASDASIERNRVCSGAARPEACAVLARSVEDMDRFRNLSTGAFIGAGVFGAATLAGLVFWKEPHTAAAPRKSRGFSVGPVMGQMNGLELKATF